MARSADGLAVGLLKDLGRTVSVVWLALLAGLAVAVILPAIFGMSPRVVTSGSMLGAIRPGDAVLVRPIAAAESHVPVGINGIITFTDPTREGAAVTHRVVDHEMEFVDGREVFAGYVTKGDANQTADPMLVRPEQVLGQVRLVVPLGGLPLLWAQRGETVWLVVLGLGTVLAMVGMRVTAHRVAMFDADGRRVPGPPPTG